jgi:hypothetical protein
MLIAVFVDVMLISRRDTDSREGGILFLSAREGYARSDSFTLSHQSHFLMASMLFIFVYIGTG